MEKIFVLDASGFIFRSYFALPEMKNPSGDNVQAVFGFIRSLGKLIKDWSPQYIIAVFDGPNNKQRRREIYPEYKSNRDRRLDDMPLQIQLVKEYCSLMGIVSIEEESVEADDVIASVATHAVASGYKVCVCSADKDLAQLVSSEVSVLNPWKEQKELGSEEIEQMFGVTPKQIPDYLGLVGDASDNIPGVAGCGPKKAVALLKEYGSVENIIENKDLLKGNTQKIITEQQEILLISKKLAVLDTTLSLPFCVKDCLFDETAMQQKALNDFYIRQGFKTLVVQETAPKEKIRVNIITSSDQLQQSLQTLHGEEFVFAAAYLGEFLPSLSLEGIAISDGINHIYVTNLSDASIDLLRTFFANGKQFYGYHIKRDIHALMNAGIVVRNVGGDLALAEHLVYGGARTSYQTLLMDAGLGAYASMFTKEWGGTSLPISKLPDNPAAYFGEFVAHLFKIKQFLFAEMQKKEVLHIFHDVEMPLEKVLFHMERKGMPLNIQELSRLERSLERELSSLMEAIYVLAGKPFNIKSPKQLSQVLFDSLGLPVLDKARSTKAEVLEALVNHHPIVEKILSFRAVEKLLSTYVLALPKQVDPHTHRIHSTFTQTRTVTGRLASQDPNLQNIPVRSEKGKWLRKAFCPDRENTYFLAADYSQIELRFLAHFSQDENLRAAFLAGEDIHAFTASQVFHVPLEKVSELQRFQAKSVNFGIVYGLQAFGLSKNLKISLKEAQGLIDAYFARYPGVAHFIEQTIEQASKDLKVTTLLGRERILDNWDSSSVVRAASGRFAVNTRIQGSSAELIKLAMLKISQVIQEKGLESSLLLQIHDELLFEVPEVELNDMQQIVKDSMESAMQLTVPLEVNILIGKNWAEC